MKTYDVVYAFYLLKRRYTRLIEEYRPFSTAIDLIHAPARVFQLYYSLLFRSCHVDTATIEHLKVECRMLSQLELNEPTFPRLQSLSIIVRRTDELSLLLKYFSFFTKVKQLYIRSDVCCCDRVSFEENVKLNLFQASGAQLRSLTFATPPCYSISLQDVKFQQCLFTNLTVRDLSNRTRWTPSSTSDDRSFYERSLLDSHQRPSTAIAPHPRSRRQCQPFQTAHYWCITSESEAFALHLLAFDLVRGR